MSKDILTWVFLILGAILFGTWTGTLILLPV